MNNKQAISDLRKKISLAFLNNRVISTILAVVMMFSIISYSLIPVFGYVGSEEGSYNQAGYDDYFQAYEPAPDEPDFVDDYGLSYTEPDSGYDGNYDMDDVDYYVTADDDTYIGDDDEHVYIENEDEYTYVEDDEYYIEDEDEYAYVEDDEYYIEDEDEYAYIEDDEYYIEDEDEYYIYEEECDEYCEEECCKELVTIVAPVGEDRTITLLSGYADATFPAVELNDWVRSADGKTLTQTVPYGTAWALINNFPMPTRDGHTMTDWEPVLPTGDITVSSTHTAQWESDATDTAFIRFHLDGSGSNRGYYIAVPATYNNGMMMIDTDSNEWSDVLAIGHLYPTATRVNQMKQFNAPRFDIGHSGPDAGYAAAFWGWFVEDELVQRSFNSSQWRGQSLRLRPNLNGGLGTVYPRTGLQANREASGIELNSLLSGIPASYFEADGYHDIHGIWIRWGDLNDDGITYGCDMDLMDEYLLALAIGIQFGFGSNIPLIHHIAADVIHLGHVYGDAGDLLESFMFYLGLYNNFGFRSPTAAILGRRP